MNLQKYINILPTELINYIFRFISYTNMPNLGITTHTKLLNSVTFKKNQLKNKSFIYIKDLTRKVLYKKAYFQFYNQLYIGKFIVDKGDAKLRPYPYILNGKRGPYFSVKGYKEKSVPIPSDPRLHTRGYYGHSVDDCVPCLI